MTAREYDATVAAALAALTDPRMTALPFTLAAVTYQERTKEKRQSIWRREYEELHSRFSEWLCSTLERSMARGRP